MPRLSSSRFFVLALAPLVVVGSIAASAQAPPTPPGAAPAGDIVLGSGSYSPIVQDLDKAIEFYGNLLS